MNTYQEFYQDIHSKIQSFPSPDNLELLTAFLIGLKSTDVENLGAAIKDLEKDVEALYQKKRGHKFLQHFANITGGNQLSPEMKDRVLGGEVGLLLRVNEVVGKEDVNQKIAPFVPLLSSPEFHEAFLVYEAEAHKKVVGTLIEDITHAVGVMRKKLPKNITPTKKNTLAKLYQPSSVGKSFISIDLREANWSSLRHWEPTLPSWRYHLGDILPPNKQLMPLFRESKHFRQVVLGVALKKHGAVKMVEETQVMLTRSAAAPFGKVFGKPYVESNDEVIYPYDAKRRYMRELKGLPHRFRLTIFTFQEVTPDGMYSVAYNEISEAKKYQLLRCTSPEKVERLL